MDHTLNTQGAIKSAIQLQLCMMDARWGNLDIGPIFFPRFVFHIKRSIKMTGITKKNYAQFFFLWQGEKIN
jgi:hypothetical protein